jgi:hypothetical protein
MIQQYKSFSFNGIIWSDLLNVTLSNDFYVACLRGSRSIIEEKIPGRDIPYFFEIDDEPLEFEVNFATEEPLTRGEIKSLARALLSHTGYKTLHFGDVVSSVYTRKTPFFNVIFTGEPDFNFIGAGTNNSGYEIYHGYFTLQVRADRPYGYVPIKFVYEADAVIGTVSASAPYTSTISGLTTGHGFSVGDVIAAKDNGGNLGYGTVTITSVSANSINVSSNQDMTEGNITNLRNLVLGTYNLLGERTIGTVSGSGPYTASITVPSTHLFRVGDIINATNGVGGGAGSLGLGPVQITATTSTTITIYSPRLITAGTITNITVVYAGINNIGGYFYNSGDIAINPGIVFTNTGTDLNTSFRIYNETNNTAVEFSSLKSGERVTISGALQTITTTSNTSIYTRWQKNNIQINSDINLIKIQRLSGENWIDYTGIINYLLTFEAPSYILGD